MKKRKKRKKRKKQKQKEPKQEQEQEQLNKKNDNHQESLRPSNVAPFCTCYGFLARIPIVEPKKQL